jgi:hypothetical protein
LFQQPHMAGEILASIPVELRIRRSDRNLPWSKRFL